MTEEPQENEQSKVVTTVRNKRELKIAPLNPEPVKQVAEQNKAETANIEAGQEKDEISSSEEAITDDTASTGFKSDFVDMGQYNIKIKKDAQKVTASGKKANRVGFTSVVFLMIFIILIGAVASIFIFKEASSSIINSITDLFI